eukprot:359172-Chlamydomonas_euryale.AAC.6
MAWLHGHMAWLHGQTARWWHDCMAAWLGDGTVAWLHACMPASLRHVHAIAWQIGVTRSRRLACWRLAYNVDTSAPARAAIRASVDALSGMGMATSGLLSYVCCRVLRLVKAESEVDVRFWATKAVKWTYAPGSPWRACVWVLQPSWQGSGYKCKGQRREVVRGGGGKGVCERGCQS